MLGKQRNLKKIWIFTVTQIILVAVHSDKSRATLWRLFLGFQTEPSICPFTCQDDWQDSNAGLWMFTIKVSLFKWHQLLYTMVKGTGAPYPEKGNTPKLLSSQSQSLTWPNLHSTLMLTHEYTRSTGSKGNREGSRKVCTREKRNCDSWGYTSQRWPQLSRRSDQSDGDDEQQVSWLPAGALAEGGNLQCNTTQAERSEDGRERGTHNNKHWQEPRENWRTMTSHFKIKQLQWETSISGRKLPPYYNNSKIFNRKNTLKILKAK